MSEKSLHKASSRIDGMYAGQPGQFHGKFTLSLTEEKISASFDFTVENFGDPNALFRLRWNGKLFTERRIDIPAVSDHTESYIGMLFLASFLRTKGIVNLPNEFQMPEIDEELWLDLIKTLRLG